MKFTDTHEWVGDGSDPALVGITAYAQKELGEVVYVELPKVGKKVKKGDEVAVLESTKAASDVYSPCSGTIVEVNAQLKEDPSLLNRSPEDEGWIVKIKIDLVDELKALLDRDAYEKLVR